MFYSVSGKSYLFWLNKYIIILKIILFIGKNNTVSLCTACGTEWDSSHFLFRVFFVKLHYLMSYNIWLCSKWIIFFNTSQIFHSWNKVCEKNGKMFLMSHCVVPPLQFRLKQNGNNIIRCSEIFHFSKSSAGSYAMCLRPMDSLFFSLAQLEDGLKIWRGEAINFKWRGH